jgi:hypothetical protein
LTFSLAELRCLLNIVFPLPVLSREFRLRWFWRRRQQRLRAIASRYQINPQRLFELARPP